MSQDPVRFFCHRLAVSFIKYTLFGDLFYIIVFFIDNLFFVIFISNIGNIHWLLLYDLLIIFQDFNTVPAKIFAVRILFLDPAADLPDLFLNLRRIFHYGICRLFLIMVLYCMKKHIQAGTFSGRYRHHRNISQQLRQAVEVNLHSPLFYNIHHI